jgi:Ubiquitin family
MPTVKPKYQTIAGREDVHEKNGSDSTAVDDEVAKGNESPLEVIILDFTHARFTVELPDGPSISTVRDLKVAGSRHHSVVPQQQRLIFQGRLLSDDTATLQDCGIHHGSIVHLFPKPRVVVVNSNTPNTNNNTSSTDEPTTASAAAAEGRVPTILVDEAEHARRGQILVLGSADYLEAVNNVKLFSFMLLIISTIELLNLIAVALGEGDPSSMSNDVIPYMEHDDFFPNDDDTAMNGNNNNSNGAAANTSGNSTSTTAYLNPYQTWSSLSWIDLVVSVLGIYVALLGIRASNENALAVARLYLVGTAITGMGWLVYNFIINFEIDEIEREKQEQPSGGRDPHPSMPMNSNNSDDSVFNQAIQAMVLPAVVWGLCIFRAWQFQHLLAEAEQEAMDRVQSEEESDEEDEEQALHQQNSSAPSSRIIS